MQTDKFIQPYRQRYPFLALDRLDHSVFRNPNILFAALVIFLLVWRIPYYGKLVLDDPYITFRYAQNLVEHGQFVFNLDEYVLATTTPIYAFINAGFAVLGLPLPLMATLLNLGFEVAVLYVLGRIIAEFTRPSWQSGVAYILVGLLTITNRAMSISSNSGMETPLFLLLNLLSLWYVLRGRYFRSSVVGSLATLTRPDGILVLIILAAVVVFHEKRFPWREIGVSLIIGLPWVIFATLTYDTFIPQSILAKDSIKDIWLSTFEGKLSVVFYEPLRFWGIFLVFLILGGGYYALRHQRHKGAILVGFVGLHLAYLALPSNLGFEWYFAPLSTMLNLLAGLGLVFLIMLSPLLRYAGIICGIGVLLGIGYSSIGNYLSVNHIDRMWRDGMLQAIDYLEQNASRGTVVQCTNIGMLGYYTDYHVLDPLGLASPQVTELIHDAANLQELRLGVATAFQPDYIISFGQEPYAGYEPVAEFPTSDFSLIVYKQSQ